MIRYIPHKEINTEKWDQCVDQDPRGLIYAKSWYLDFVSPGWDGMVYGDYEVVLPLPQKKKWGIKYLMWPFGAQQLGFFSKQPVNATVLRQILEAIPKRFWFYDLRLNQGDDISALESEKLIPNLNYTLSLDASYEDLYRGFSKQLKRNLKKSQKEKLTVSTWGRPETLVSLLKNEKGGELGHITEGQYKMMEKIQHVLIARNRGVLLSAHDQKNSVCAMAFFAIHNNRIIYLFGVNTSWGKQVGAMAFLMNEVIIQYAQKGYLLDFEGSNHPGIARFFESFGAKSEKYHRVLGGRLGGLVEILNKILK